ncbi:MAG: glycosyltransferase [Thermomicrobiales bacterium]
MRVALMVSEDVESMSSYDFLKEAESELGTKTANRVVGRFAAVSAMVRAFAKYGRHEYVVCPVGVPDAADWEELGSSIPMPLLAPKDLVAWARDEPTVLFELARHRLSRLSNLRSTMGLAQIVVAAQMHGLGDPRLIDDLCVTLLSPIRTSDVIFASSQPARLALQAALAEAQDVIRRRGGSVDLPRIVEVSLGIDSDQFTGGDRSKARQVLGWPDGEFVFLSLGRLSDSDKFDHRPLIRAFAKGAASWTVRVRLVIAGNDGNDRSRAYVSDLQQLVEELGVADSVEIRNRFAPELRRMLYTGADAFLALSDSVGESFGLTVAEAQAAALPVIAVDWDGFRDQIDHGRSGLLVPTIWGDRLEDGAAWQLLASGRELDLANAQTVGVDWSEFLRTMHQLVCMSDAERAAIGDAGCRVAHGRDWSNVVRKYEGIWENTHVTPSQPLLGDTHTRRSHIFRGYATRLLDSSMSVALGPLWDERGPYLNPAWDLQRTVCDAQLADEIVGVVWSKSGQRTRIEKIEQRFADRSKGIVDWHILWLVKHGVLRIAIADPLGDSE